MVSNKMRPTKLKEWEFTNYKSPLFKMTKEMSKQGTHSSQMH
jgi:hypothetical protein